MSRTMRAVRLDAIGPAENLRLVEVPVPELPDDGVLIRTACAGMIYADVEARRGTYYRKTALPWFPGREVAGTIAAVGRAVSGWEPGQRVAALVMGGGCYAEHVVARTAAQPLPGGGAIPPSDIVALPDGVGEGAALVYLVNYRLAHLLVHAWARVSRGDAILVHGASGGMGTMILEIARELECDSIALVRSEEEARFCRRLGAAHCIDVARADHVAETLALTGGRGVACSFNGVGGETVNSDPRALARFGEILLYGYVAGKRPFDPFATDRSIALKTFNADDFLGGSHFAEATAAMLRRFAAGGLLEPGARFPLAEAAAAHRAMESGKICGKIVLEP